MAEIKIWETPFKDGDIEIISTIWGDGSLDAGYCDKRDTYSLEPTINHLYELSIEVFHRQTNSIYGVFFESISAFRMLDENGLLEIWEARDTQSIEFSNTYYIKDHQWSKESFISFYQSYQHEWSFLLATDFMCVEILSSDHPKIMKKEDRKIKIGKISD